MCYYCIVKLDYVSFDFRILTAVKKDPPPMMLEKCKECPIAFATPKELNMHAATAHYNPIIKCQGLNSIEFQ